MDNEDGGPGERDRWHGGNGYRVGLYKAMQNNGKRNEELIHRGIGLGYSTCHRLCKFVA